MNISRPRRYQIEYKYKLKCPVCRKFFNTNHKKTYCRTECAKRGHSIRRKYGIESSEVVKIYKQQKGRCAICRGKGDVHEMGFTTRNLLVIDHCHSKGHVRGLLCYSCNVGLGHFRDSKKYLAKAMEYLEENK